MENASEPHVSPGPSFSMVCCANGAEICVKQALQSQGWRLAFSRPGFITFKNDQQVEPPTGIFVRTAAHSLGQARGTHAPEQVQKLTDTLKAKFPANHRFDQLHVWPRDRLPIGKFGFEPGIDEVATAVADEIHGAIAEEWLSGNGPNRAAEPGQRVLDIVLVDPAHWFFGWHTAGESFTCWPGAVQQLDPEHEPISRAYYKAAEAIAWSGFDLSPGDTVVEIGSSPGGACGRLLELGLNVIGIDPAEMDSRIADHPRFEHHRARAGDLPRKVFRGVKWLLADSNVKPEKTLTTIHNIVNHRECSLRGMLLTLKLGNYEVARKIPDWIEQMRQWNPQAIQVRQLARNRCEVCVAVRLS